MMKTCKLEEIRKCKISGNEHSIFFQNDFIENWITYQNKTINVPGILKPMKKEMIMYTPF